MNKGRILHDVIKDSVGSYDNIEDCYNEWRHISNKPVYYPEIRTHCRCGTRISYEFIIRNIHNHKEHIIGGTCIGKFNGTYGDVGRLKEYQKQATKIYKTKLKILEELKKYEELFGWKHTLNCEVHYAGFLFVLHNYRRKKAQMELIAHKYVTKIKNIIKERRIKEIKERHIKKIKEENEEQLRKEEKSDLIDEIHFICDEFHVVPKVCMYDDYHIILKRYEQLYDRFYNKNYEFYKNKYDEFIKNYNTLDYDNIYSILPIQHKLSSVIYDEFFKDVSKEDVDSLIKKFPDNENLKRYKKIKEHYLANYCDVDLDELQRISDNLEKLA